MAGTLKGARNRDAAGQGASIQNSRQAYVNLALATAAFAVAFAAWSMISPLSHQIQADFNLDNTSIGLLIALPTLLGALMRVPMGVLTDRFGGRKVFTGLLLSRCCRSPSWASPTRFGPTWSGRSFWESPARASRPAFHSSAVGSAPTGKAGAGYLRRPKYRHRSGGTLEIAARRFFGSRQDAFLLPGIGWMSALCRYCCKSRHSGRLISKLGNK